MTTIPAAPAAPVSTVEDAQDAGMATARLTDEEMRQIEEQAQFSWQVPRAVESAVLRKLRGTPGERNKFEAWAQQKSMPLARVGEQYDDFWVDHAWNGWQARAAIDAPAAGDALTAAARDVLAERHRQVSTEFWTPEHDDKYRNGELAEAGAAYAHQAASPCGEIPEDWPWDAQWWKPATPRRNLVKSAALILAEIERLDRAAQRKGDA